MSRKVDAGWRFELPVMAGLYWERFQGATEKRLIVLERETMDSLWAGRVYWRDGGGVYLNTPYADYFREMVGVCEWCGPGLAPPED